MAAIVDPDEKLGAMAVRLITDHVADCTEARRRGESAMVEVKQSIRDLSSLLIRFIGGVIAAVVVFAGYSFVQTQSLSAQLTDAKVAAASAAAAARSIPDETVRKLDAQPTP